MVAPTTRLEYAQQQHSTLLQHKKNAQERVSQAQLQVSTARAAHAQATSTFTKVERQAATIREQLAKIATSADGEVLLDELEQTLIALRASQAAILATEENNAVAQAELEQATCALRSAEILFAEAVTALEEAVLRDGRNKKAKEVSLQPPLSTLPTAALVALSGVIFTAAQARIAGDIPAALIARARERRETQRKFSAAATTALTNIEDVSSAEEDAHGGVAGHVEISRVDLLRKEALLFDYVLHAQERYDRALAILTRLADPQKPQLSEAQKARIHDASLKTDRETAATKEQERDLARSAVAEKQAALEVAIVKAQVKDIDAQVNLDADVIAAQAALSVAETALATAEAAYTAARKKTVDTWEAAVPDSAWHDLADFEEAKALLHSLKDITPGALGTAMSTAEQAFVTALVAADKRTRTVRLLQERKAEKATRWKIEQSLVARRLFSALRGD